VEVNEQYVGYKIMKYDNMVVMEKLDLPPLNFKTKGLWFIIPEDIKEKIWKERKKDKDIKEKLNKRYKEYLKREKNKDINEKNLKREIFAGGLHGIEHAMIGIMPFHVMCDRWNLGGVSTPNHPDTMEPTIFVYDGFEGGIGLAEKSYELITEIVKMTYELVRDCKCENACPACILSPKCGNDNEPLDKKGTILILKELLHRMEIKNKVIHDELKMSVNLKKQSMKKDC